MCHFLVAPINSDNTSIVTLTTEPAVFNVTVPTVLPVSVDSNNNVSVANNAQIVNNGNGSIEVTNVTVIGYSDWDIVDFDTDFTKIPVNTKQYGLKIQGADVYDESIVTRFDFINGLDSLDITYDANVAIQSTPITDLDIGRTIFTIAWHKAD